MEFLAGWTGLILGFSGLIFIHELGHFLLAKWNGVRVHVFSIGMGPYIVSYTHNGTIYALSLIPMGGYVKMLGQDDLNADLSANKNPSDFRNKRPGQKAAILGAGAGFNILLTIFIYTMCYWTGMNVQAPCIGNIPKGVALSDAVLNSDGKTPANLQKGDRILEVGDIPVKSFFDVMLQVTAYPSGQSIGLKILRKNGEIVHIDVKMEEDKKQGIPNIGLNAGTVYEEEETLPLGFWTEWYLIIDGDPSELKDSPAAKTGKFKKGDRIVKLEDRTDPKNPKWLEMDSKFALTNAAAATGGKPRYFYVERDGKPLAEPIEVTAEKNAKEGGYKFGLKHAILKRVTKIDENSVAYKAGLRVGDLVRGFAPDASNVNPNYMPEKREPWKSGDLVWTTKFDGEDIKKHIDIPKQDDSGVRQNPEAVVITLNDGRVFEGEIDSDSDKGILLKRPSPQTPITFKHDEIQGIAKRFSQEYVVEEKFIRTGFLDALGTSWDDTRHYTSCMFATIRNLVTGHVKAQNLSGPVGIGRSIFAVAAKQSLKEFFWWLAFISLNLGVMQLLPIPLLDGFHLVMVLVEKIKGSMVHPKIQEVFMYVGLAMIGSLLLYVMFNDVSKFFTK